MHGNYGNAMCCFLQAIMSVVLEVAFPQFAIIRLRDGQLRSNHESLSALLSGTLYCGGRDGGVGSARPSRMVIAGSHPEGLAMEDGWGHPEADVDTMWLLEGPLRVHVPQNGQLSERTGLVYQTEGCSPTYCKIEVLDPDAIFGAKIGVGRLDATCIHRTSGADWLHTDNILRKIHGSCNISGPASQAGGGLLEFVPTLVCDAAHPDMQRKYMERPRQCWPSPQQLKVIQLLPMF